MHIPKALWCCLALASALVLTGCSSVWLTGSGGGARALVGPVSLEAVSQGKVLPKFLRDGYVHIVGEQGKSFDVAVQNHTARKWQIYVQRHRGQEGKKRVGVLSPYQRVFLYDLLKEKFLFPNRKGEKGLLSLKRVQRLTVWIKKVNKETANKQGNDEKNPRDKVVQAGYQVRFTYGLCEGYRSRRLYSEWCRGPAKHSPFIEIRGDQPLITR